MFRVLLILVGLASAGLSQLQIVSPSVAAVDDPMAIKYNPAGLAFNDHTETILMTHFQESEFTKDFAYFSQSQNTGFGYQWDVKSATNIWSFSQGFKISRSHRLGVTYSFDDSDWLSGRYNLGWMHRPFPLLAMGFQIENVWSGAKDPIALNGGLAFQNRTGRFGAGLDIKATEGAIDPTTSLSGFVELLKGVRLSGHTELGKNSYFLSLSVFMPTMGFESHGRSSSFSSQTLMLRSTVNPYRSLFDQATLQSDSKTYLRMKLSGTFIEEPEMAKPLLPMDLDINIPFIGGATVYGKQLKKFIDEMKEYTADPDVDGMIIDLGSVRAGFSKLTEMRQAFQDFHDAGKEIIVYSKFGLGNGSTYLLSMADEIYVHEMADVGLRGLSMEITFYRGLLDTLSIVPEVWRVSPYKTAADPYLNDQMSTAMRENYSQLLDGIYDEFIAGLAEGKDWELDHTRDIVDNGPYLLTEAAQEAGLITGTLYPDEFEDYVMNLNDGEVDIKKIKTREDIPGYRYTWRDDKVNERIAVIYAVGDILPGKSQRGPGGSTVMGDETIAKAIKAAREDKSIKAIVLRIDSGGGSSLASDIMWREVLKTTETDSVNVKPLIASMSDIAASGGYYIACQADSIIAYPTTITGSIGVIGNRLNFSQLRERFGIKTDGLKAGKHADFVSSNRLTTQSEDDALLASLNDTYLRFKQKVIKGRDRLDDIGALDSVALGRVWTAVDARKHGLVDELGGYYDAIELAKAAAGIDGEVEIIELPRMEKRSAFKSLMGNNTQLDALSTRILESLAVDDLIPLLEGGEIQMIMPVKIEIK